MKNVVCTSTLLVTANKYRILAFQFWFQEQLLLEVPYLNGPIVVNTA